MLGGGDLADRATRVVADEGDALELQLLEQLGERGGDPGGGEVGVLVHRHRVGAERHLRDDAAVVGLQPLDQRVPEPAVDEQAVNEDERVATAAAVAVADRPLREPCFFHAFAHTACMYNRYSLYVNVSGRLRLRLRLRPLALGAGERGERAEGVDDARVELTTCASAQLGDRLLLADRGGVGPI